MRHGSLFSGIGGFDLAAEWMEWENVFHCEWNEFGKKVLKYYWPNAISYNDITKTDFSIHRGSIDILTGGFPCQPYSSAGKRKGKDDERHLWPEMLRAIREIQPSWVVGENVFGLINWNRGMVFDEVQADLEAAGYEVWPYVLPACAVNAPHRRDRVWFVAHCNGLRRREKYELQQTELHKQYGKKRNPSNANHAGLQKARSEQPATGIEQYRELGVPITNPDGGERCEGRLYKAECETAERYISTRNARSYKRTAWQNFPTQSPICNGDDGLSPKLDAITFPRWRSESIKAGGNAIVPNVAFEIFKAIELYEAA